MTTEYSVVVAAISCGILLLLGLALFALMVVVWPAWTRRRALRAQARQDFLNARGTVHRQLLSDALRAIVGRKASCAAQLAEAKRQKAMQEQRLDRELYSAYSRWIVAEHFHEIYGIGPKLREQILSQVFHGRLSDLHQSHIVPGVGDARQSTISQWVRQYEAKRPEYFRAGFPGQADTKRTFEHAVQMEEGKINALSQELTTLNERAAAVQQALSSLDGISEADFLEVFRHPDQPDDRLAVYLRGVYEEWEPMPMWFREALEVQP